MLDWARANDHVLFTNDLDFGAILALTQAAGPSVIQIRTQDVTPGHLEPTLIHVIENNRSVLEAGCLIVVEETRARVRILPLTLRS
jgi:predicted nuclease of predicted toxin-antitoxin system